ncbi:MAG: hypothetical protein QXW76_04715 [Candidatus Korarchaeum sp.]
MTTAVLIGVTSDALELRGSSTLLSAWGDTLLRAQWWNLGIWKNRIP